MLIQGAGLPFFSLLLIAVFFKNSDVSGVTISYALSSFTVFVLSVVAWKSANVSNVEKSKYVFESLWASCKPLLVASIMNRAILPWAPLFLLGIWSNSEDIGTYGAASRVVMLVSLMLITVNNVIAPKFAELYSNGDLRALESVATRLALVLTLLAAPIFLLFIFQGKLVMSLFGDGFVKGHIVLQILSIGQIVNVMTGAIAFILLMSGNEGSFQRISIWSTIGMLVISIITIPMWGDVGAALAVAVSLSANNIAAVWIVYKKLNIMPIPFLSSYFTK